MNKTSWVVITLSLLYGNDVPAQGANAYEKQLQISVQNGLSSLLTKTAIDSVYFLKAGYHAGIQGNYYWNNFGLAGRAGYFANASDKQSLEDFARRRKAPRDRMEISAGSYKSVYLFTGPAFQSSFSKWSLESNLQGGVINKPASQVRIGDNASPDIVYYRNVFEASSSFAWAAGLSISYAVSRQFLLGVNADYLNTRNEVVNYDIQRSGGREAKNISSQAGFLNTGLRLSYLLSRQQPRDAASGMASGKRTEDNNGNGKLNDLALNNGKAQDQKANDTCNCENKVMEAREMVPYIVEIQFATVSEAKKFLDTYEPLLERRDAATGQSSGRRQHMQSAQSNPLYQSTGNQGVNPLYESKSELRTVSNTPGMRGLVQRNAQGEQVFYMLPTTVDLGEVLSFDDGRVTVHVQREGKGSDPGMTKREAGSGLATGRRTYKAIAAGDLDGDGINDFLIASSGHTVKSPRDLASGQSSGKRSKIDAFTIKQGIVEADLDGDGEYEPLGNVKAPRDVASGQSSGKRSMAKEDVYVWKIKYGKDIDGDGIADGYIFSGLNKDAPLLNKLSNQSLNIVAEESANEGIARKLNSKAEEGYQPWDDNTSANKVVEKATSGIKQTMQTQVLVTNNDNSSDEPVQKAGISTSRSNIRTHKLLSCGDSSCVISCEIELDGKIYQALITSKTRHDTVKNSIGNIR
ncbi:MAG: VCBS repeat-containing protein [Chitinophagaceae bacterium]